MATRVTPEVKWAQRSCHEPSNNYVIVTIEIRDVGKDDLKLDLQEYKVILDAHSARQDVHYQLELGLHDDIYPNETITNHTDRQLELTLFKAEPDSWWPRLLSDKDTPPYVRQDFDRWVNKDAQDGELDSEEEHINNMNRDELRTMADAALSMFQDSVTPTDEQSSSKDQDTDDGSDSEEDNRESASDDDRPTRSDNDDSDDAGSPPPPDGSNPHGHTSEDHGHSDDDGHGSGNNDSSLDKTSSNYDKPSKGINGNEGQDWASKLDGVKSMLTTAGRELPWHLRPITFEAWKKRSDRTIEILNFRKSRFLQLPREIRLQIYEFAMVSDDPVQFCPRLRQHFHRLYGEMVDQRLYAQNHSFYSMKSEIRRAKKEHRSDYFLGDDFKWCEAPDLLLVSRAVSEEAGLVLYRKNTFAFRDIHGFVALECFLNTISQFNLNQLRKLEVHVPIWYHGPALDKLRSTWVFKSAENFGLKASTPHKDRLRGSFEASVRKLAKSGRLKELNLIISHKYLPHWQIDYHHAAAEMPKNKQIVYAKRLSMEEYLFKHILSKIPKLKITVVAEEGYSSSYLRRSETVPGQRVRYESYFSAIKAKCKQNGFGYVRKPPNDVRDFMRIMFEDFTAHN